MNPLISGTRCESFISGTCEFKAEDMLKIEEVDLEGLFW